MNTYTILYTDKHDEYCPIFSTRIRAYNRDHAEIIFFNSADVDNGWRIVSIKKEPLQ